MQHAVKNLMRLRGTDIKVEIIPADRKTYAIKVLQDGTVELRIPRHMAVKEIETALEKHRDWIISASQKQKVRFSDSFADGALVPFFGRTLVLATGENGEAYLDSANGRLCLPKEDRVSYLTEIYRSAAKELIPKRVKEWADAYDFTYQSVRINSAKSRWGSCSGQKRLNFSLRTMMLSPDCIDYILVHELCHLRHMDHSAAFYKEVERILPDYKERQKAISESFVLLL